jgi:hypothetical protein
MALLISKSANGANAVADVLFSSQYLLVLDAINFCFWPSEGQWEYDALACALKDAITKDRTAFCAESLAALDEGLFIPWPLTTVDAVFECIIIVIHP